MKKLFLILLFLFPSLAMSAPAFVQGTSTYTGGSPQSKAFGSNNTAGNMITVYYQDADLTQVAIGTPTITDTQGNIYRLAKGPISKSVAGGTVTGYIYYANNIKAGANTVTLTAGSSGADTAFHIAEFSGVSTSNPLIQTASGTAPPNGTAYSTGNIVTTVSDALLVAGGGQSEAAGTNTAGTNWNMISSETNHNSFNEYRIVSSTGTYSASATGPSATTWVMLMAQFAPDTGPVINNATINNAKIQ